MPVFALAVNYWLHLLATVTWLGGLVMLVLVAWPEIRRSMTVGSSEKEMLLASIENRFRTLSNISLVVLLVTGLIQMDGDSHYAGFLTFTNAWSISLLAKHVVVLLMLVVAGGLQWVVQPALDRARLASRREDQPNSEVKRQHRRLRRLTILNLAMGILVLIFTAYMTAL